MGNFRLRDIGILSQVSENPVWSGLLSYWRLDESAGTTAYDSKGTYNGTATNLVGWVAGKNNNGAQFNSTNSMISMGNVHNFERTDTWTFTAWLKRTTNNTNSMIWGKQNHASPYNGFSAYIRSGGDLEIGLINSYPSNMVLMYAQYYFTSTTNWYHIVWTYNGNSKANGNLIYVNGSLVTNYTTAYNSLSGTIKQNNNFVLGSRNANLGANGILDEVGVWNRVLSTAEVSTLYNSGTGLFY